MKFQMSHKDRSVFIALGNQIRRETNKDVTSTFVVADEQFYE
ncbi:MAG: hypothetical protein WC233_00705 [Sphaerochaeta sp.]|jgi:hypothetical protein